MAYSTSFRGLIVAAPDEPWAKGAVDEAMATAELQAMAGSGWAP